MEIYKLTNSTIDMLSEKVGEMYESVGCTKKEVLRAKLLLEESLLKYQSRFGEETELYFRSYRILSQCRFSIRLRTPSFDPFTPEENPMAFMLETIMSGFETQAPTWKYKNLENEILFSVRKKAKIGSLSRILIFVALALILGIGARLLFSQDKLFEFVGDYVTPLSDAYAGLFCIMAVLMTFFSIVLSIVHIGDMASVGALGGQIMRQFFSISGIVVIVITLPILPFFNLNGVGSFNVAAKSLYDILIGFIPTNLVSSFLDFNTVHIMIVGAMFGFSLLVMGQKGSSLTKLFSECDMAAVISNNFLNRFIFLYVAMKVFAIVSTGDFSRLSGAGKMAVAILGAEVVLLIFYTARTCIKTKIPLGKFVKSAMPATLIALSSANLGAAFRTMSDGIMSNGADADTVNLSANLGSIFFQPAGTTVFVFSSLFVASACNVEISVIWVIMSIILSIILIGATPNVPGASLSVVSLLFAQLGIPVEGLSMVIAIYAILQFPTVAVDAWCLQGEILCIDHTRKKRRELREKQETK